MNIFKKLTGTTDNNAELPQINTPLPGPVAKEIIERDKAYLSTSLARDYPFVIRDGEGALVTDVDGNRFLDLAAGIAVSTTGYAHPEISRVVKERVDQFMHISGTVFYYDIQVRLAQALCERAPIKGTGGNRVFFTNSGTESVEGAIKLARWATKRPNIIAFYGGFHGRSLGALSLTASRAVQRTGFAPLMPSVYHAFYPTPYVCPYNKATPHTVEGCLQFIKDTLFARMVDPKEVAAFVLEPIQGEGGYIVPPPEFFKAMRQLCDEHGIMMIMDEVQSGIGRTGKMFATEHYNVEADIIILAKGIASGLPLGAFIANSKVMSWPPGSHSSTFGGNPVACAAALKTIELLEDGGIMQNAAEVGDYLLQKLKKLVRKYPAVGDVRGKGLMIGLEIVKGARGKPEPDMQRRNAILQSCFRHGLLTLGCGFNTIRIAPPLVLTKAQADAVVRIIETAIRETG